MSITSQEPSPVAVTASSRRRVMMLVGIGGLAAAILVLAFVWPTRYRYDTLRRDGGANPVRIDRFTGGAEALTPGGWVQLRASDSNALVSVPLSPEQLSRLDGTATVQNHGWISADIYNGNDFEVNSIVIGLTVIGIDGKSVLSRDYKLSTTNGDPLCSSEYITDVGFHLDPGQIIQWHIKSADRWQ